MHNVDLTPVDILINGKFKLEGKFRNLMKYLIKTQVLFFLYYIKLN